MDLKFHFSGIVFLSLIALSAVQRVHRACERCMRHPTNCRRISGLYTVTVLTEGTYYPVVEIPASACSINITELGRSRNYIAVKTASNKGIVNSYWSLGQPGQYYGAGSRFAYDRASGKCIGSCLYAEGPTTERTIVQLLYYSTNPGITYEFVLPNSVSFQPLNGPQSSIPSSRSRSSSSRETSSSASLVLSSLKSPSLSSSSSFSAAAKAVQVPRVSLSPSSSSSLHSSRRRYRSHHRRHGYSPSAARLIRRTNGGNSRSEYYNGFISSRDEGRPDETAAAEGGEPLSLRRIVVNERKPYNYNYTNNGYGSHTLNGRGLSYTHAGSPARTRTEQRRPRTHERYISGPSSQVRRISAPQYKLSSSSNRLSYARQQRRHQSLTTKHSYLNEASQPVNTRYLKNDRSSSSRGHQQVRFRWKISGLTKCSRSCGGGVQKTNVVCVSLSARKVVVTPDNCVSSLKPRVQTVECNSSPCKPKWEADKWSDCSVTCGSGTQTRKIECRQRFSPSLTLRVSADQCGLDMKPAVAQQCEEGLCSAWSSGQWGQCTKDCGGGERRRHVRCVDGVGSTIPSNYCTDARPKDREECNTQECQAQWWTSEWSSQCSETCGSGYQVRSALCMNGEGSVTSESSCRKEDFPELTKTCYGGTSCRGTWFAGSWGRCSAKCGKGTKRRAVICLQAKAGGSVAVSAGQCNPNLKPLTEESCVNTDCTALWFTSPWSKCPVMCGDGYKSRDVSCINQDGTPSTQCEPSIKPEAQQTCSLESCNLYQRTDGRLADKFDRTETGLRKVESDTKSEKRREPLQGHETTTSAQEQKEEKGDDFDIDSYDESREGSKSKENASSVERIRDYGEDDNDNDVDSRASNNAEVDFTRGKKCEDKYWNCLMVVQSRLCLYDYYKDLCCHTCRGVK